MKLLAIALALFAQAVTAPPPPGPPRPVELPKPSETTLKNGLRVIVVQRHEEPLVDVQLLIKTGGEADPANEAGLADVTASLLTKGTKTRSAVEIARDIEALGANLDSGAMWDASTVSVNGMSSNLPKALGIMSDVVLHPVFAPDELERLRKQDIDALQEAMADPGEVARFVAARVLFDSTPYGHNLGGTPQSLQRIKRDDVVDFHQRYYQPANAVLVFGGDVTPERAFALAEEFFGSWPRGGEAILPVQSAAAPSTHRVVVIDMPDAGQAAVTVIRPGLRRVDPAYDVAQVANSVLGGGYSSRLNEEIRIKRGLSYGAGSGFDFRRDAGPFVASAQTKNESAPEVAGLIVEEMNKLAAAPVDLAELTPRKAALIGSFGRSLETNGGLVGRISGLALYGLPLDELQHYIPQIESVTAPEVRQFAAAHLDAADADIIIAGDAKKFLDALKKSFPNVEVISMSELDLDSATLKNKG